MGSFDEFCVAVFTDPFQISTSDLHRLHSYLYYYLFWLQLGLIFKLVICCEFDWFLGVKKDLILIIFFLYFLCSIMDTTGDP